MKLIIGLGNPGDKYAKTRHNIGFCVIDKIAKEKGISFNFDKKFEAEVGENNDIKLAKPQTFMNNSGEVVSKLKSYYKIDLNDIIIIHDDVDLDIGKIRISLGGSSAGHKGVQSIIDSIGTDQFRRVRIGVGKSDQIPTEDWVLKNFEDQKKITDMVDKISDFMVQSLSKGLENQTININ